MQTSIPFHKIDEHVRQHYKCSFMSIAKWKKLLNAVGDVCHTGFTIRFRLIHGGNIGELRLYQADDQFFAEPTHYKEVEWIEFPNNYECMINPNNRKAGMTIRPQDLGPIRAAISAAGEFEAEDLNDSVRIYGYR